ncbi:hypothetical protein [Neomoorella humiferrea]|uniref:hypothetical protein n=1 Tax=Neomoorella humiferrea TaxID=676965 RepID=UPI0030D5DE44
MAEEARQEIVSGRREAAAGEEKLADFGFYLLVDRISNVKGDLQQQLVDTKDTLADRINNVKNDLQKQISDTKDGLEAKINNVKNDLQKQISDTKEAQEARFDNKIEALRQEVKNDINRLDSKLDNTRWWSIATFFAVLLGSLAIAYSIYFAK